MNVLEQFKDLFIEIWKQGIAGVNFTQIGLAIGIFLFFLLLRGLVFDILRFSVVVYDLYMRLIRFY